MILSIVDAALKIGAELVEDKDKKAELAYSTLDALLKSKTYAFVDALVKLSFASEQIIKGLVRPLVSTGMFVYGVLNPDVLAQLHALGTAGDIGVAAMLGSAPAWGYSRHQEKKRKEPDWDPDDDL